MRVLVLEFAIPEKEALKVMGEDRGLILDSFCLDCGGKKLYPFRGHLLMAALSEKLLSKTRK